MSGTPSTSERSHNYTVLGKGPDASRAKLSAGTSLIVIARGRKYQRIEDVRYAAELGYFDTTVLMPRDSSIPLDKLINQYSNLRILLFDPLFFTEESSPGGLINLALTEVRGDWVIVSWTGVQIPVHSFVHPPAAQNILCRLPLIQNSKYVAVPSFAVPVQSGRAGSRKSLEVLPILPDAAENESLYPFDYCGIYSVERFKRTGGFDEEIKNQYWQKMEFGCRARLWGEHMCYEPGFKLIYPGEPEAEESTPDRDYLKFYLRILAVQYTGDRAQLPLSKIIELVKASNMGFFRAWELFRSQQKWVRKHQYNYRRDARQMVELWGEKNDF